MITGDIKQKVDAVWQTFWNNGFTQPSAIFEQMTYLLFMKMLDEKQQEKESIANLTGDKLLDPTFPEGVWHNPSTDQDVPYSEMRWHIFKEMEPARMLNRVRNDVFIFLRHIGGEGSAGFIMEAAKYIKEHQGNELLNIDVMKRFRSEIFHGSDSDASMLRIGCMNMMLHDVDEPNLYYRNSLSDENNDTNKYTLCLANPPFAGSLDQDDIAHTLKSAVKTKKTELLFLALMMRILQTGGRCASVVPDTVLTGDAQAYKTIRSALVDTHCLQAVITMPSGVFQPYSGVSTAIIIFTKTGTGGTDKVWFYDMRADGFSLTTQRIPTPEQNDIPDVISRFHHLDAEVDRNRKEQSFFVNADEIRENGYDLSYKRYHEVEREAVQYDAPEVIIARMEERQKAIDAAFAEFKKLLNS